MYVCMYVCMYLLVQHYFIEDHYDVFKTLSVMYVLLYCMFVHMCEVRTHRFSRMICYYREVNPCPMCTR